MIAAALLAGCGGASTSPGTRASTTTDAAEIPSGGGYDSATDNSDYYPYQDAQIRWTSRR